MTALSHVAHEGQLPLKKTSFWALTLGAIGVVYGDIGTSPLYAVKESLNAARSDAALSPEMIYGVLSLMIWALIIIVTIKYVLVMLRADNDGEGGTLSLMALAQRALGDTSRVIVILGMSGAALFYGDAMITPAISVLSAVEGLSLVTPSFEPYVLPICVVILVALFSVQSRGTASMAAWFGPIILVWFAALAIGGISRILEKPDILLALNPVYGATFLASHGIAGLLALGSVFLAVTGAEALYADLGHFGRKPIRFAWMVVAFPALSLNYFGQGALLLNDPASLQNPFYLLYPEWALIPMVALATMATIIASQAVITGAYSVTHQAIQLGLLPRLEIRRTSETEKGQIYIPSVNWLLLVSVLFLTLSFRNSSALAAAYGIAVTGTMVVTVMLASIVARHVWGWAYWRIGLVMGSFFIIDAIFLGANVLKIASGGWMPLVVGLCLLGLMLTWRRGVRLLLEKTSRLDLDLDQFLKSLAKKPPEMVPGTAVFLTGNANAVPTALLHNLKHNKVLHRRNIIVGVKITDTPRVDEAERGHVRHVTESFSVVTLQFGFMEDPDVPRALARRRLGLELNPLETSYYLSRRALRPAARSVMPQWQTRIFIWLAKHASDITHYFKIPTDRAIEIGTQIAV